MASTYTLSKVKSYDTNHASGDRLRNSSARIHKGAWGLDGGHVRHVCQKLTFIISTSRRIWFAIEGCFNDRSKGKLMALIKKNLTFILSICLRLLPYL